MDSVKYIGMDVHKDTISIAVRNSSCKLVNRYATMRSKPSTWSGRLEQILLIQAGWKARKHPAVREVFFLTFPFYRTYQELARWSAGCFQLPSSASVLGQ
jgi:hypothetical protein